ncbi:MAG: hypothetical protein MJK04_35830 [Psychrosphaera sp.]|nr:hypothetical protein [Psychrosphaera sp.]
MSNANNTSTPTSTPPSAPKKTNLINYISFTFTDGDRQINATGDIFGKEVIYVNGQQISKKRNYKIKSIHAFTLGEDQYELEYHVTNLFTSTLKCTLIKNNVHFKTQTWKPFGKYSLYVVLGLGFVAGLVGALKFAAVL